MSCSSQGDRADPLQSSSDSLIQRGESLYVAERLDTARTVWTVALRHTRASSDARNEARALTWLGLVATRLGDLSEARGLGEEALAIKTRLGMKSELARSYGALGMVALSENRNQDAVGLFERALESARAAGDRRAEAESLGRLGLARTYLGDFARARAAQREARLAARALGEKRLETNALANEAMIDIWEGNAADAIPRLDTARAEYGQIGFAAGEQNALGQLGTAFGITGQEDQAFVVLDRSLGIARRLGLREEVADLLRLIGGLHLRIGDYRLALRHYSGAEAEMRSAGLTANLGSVLRGAATAHLRLRNVPRAEAVLGEALRLHQAGDEPLELLDDLVLASEVDYRRGGLPRAEPRLREARRVAEQVNTRSARIAVALAEAHLADLSGDSRRVLRVLDAGGPDMVMGDYGAEWVASSLAARAYARINQLDSAVLAGRIAVTAVERLRGGLASEALRATYVADRSDVYGDLVLALLKLDRQDEAFALADAARSRSLLEHMAAARAGVLPEILEGERVLRRIDELVQKLSATQGSRRRERGASPDSVEAPLHAELGAARGEYEALLARSAQRNPRATALLGARPVRLEAVQAALQPGEVLLEYLLTSERMIVFAVSATAVRIHQARLAGPSLIQRIRLVRDLWGGPSHDWRMGLPAAGALYQTLIAPLRESGMLEGAKRLFIVPHGMLGQMPFAALHDPRTGQFLAQDVAVVHLPSAGALPALRERTSAGGDLSSGGTGFAPVPGELRATRTELHALRASLPGTRLRFGGDATEARVREALGGHGLVHVATHGILNARHPMFSRIELARPARVRTGDDGRLEVHEILGLEIRSPLVFFSGCETGAGLEWTAELVRGTGDLTLAQAVLSAGAANIVMTLWRIDDVGAAEFAAGFYRSLRTMPVAEALASAQRELAASTRYASPYYWAGYTLSGGGGPAPGAQGAATPSVVSRGTLLPIPSPRSQP
jgi:CHAT domain-containing protein/tetratricopeptide (TPR) repeat protein